MYITAHRVTNDSDGTTGVNCFYHLHNGVLGVSDSWGGTEVDKIANQTPGNLIHRQTEIPPGGNSVLSYVEVICEDDTPPSAIESALESFEESVDSTRLQIENNILIFFSTIRGLSGQERLEYQKLRGAVTRLISGVPVGK